MMPEFAPIDSNLHQIIDSSLREISDEKPKNIE